MHRLRRCCASRPQRGPQHPATGVDGQGHGSAAPGGDMAFRLCQPRRKPSALADGALRISLGCRKVRCRWSRPYRHQTATSGCALIWTLSSRSPPAQWTCCRSTVSRGSRLRRIFGSRHNEQAFKPSQPNRDSPAAGAGQGAAERLPSIHVSQWTACEAIQEPDI